MTSLASRRLPGVRFETVAPPLPEALPRMDVAAFVGFAASGPLDTPVAVEDIERFHEIFGRDAPIAWDGQRGETVSAYLAPAVRAFFRNGGVRCWVVRVASVASACSNEFELPGLRAHTFGEGTHEAVQARARSEGSWSDALRVATSLGSRVVTVAQSESAYRVLSVWLASDSELLIGDLLRVRFTVKRGDAVRAAPSTLYLPIEVIEAIEPVAGPAGARPASRGVLMRVSSEHPLWLTASGAQPTLSVLPPDDLSLLTFAACERLTLQLWWRWGDGPTSRLSELGFSPVHPRFWGALPSDQELFAAGDADGPTVPNPALPLDSDRERYRELRAAAREPRVPLAGPVKVSSLYLPLGISELPREWSPSGATADTARERDGLSRFEPELFFDGGLKDVSVDRLSATADYLRYQSSDPRPLRGIHALVGVDEATLVAVPDAVLPSWQPSTTPQPVAPPPADPTPPRPAGACDACRADERTFADRDFNPPPAPVLTASRLVDLSYALEWSEITGADYELQEALEPQDAATAVAYAGTERMRRFYDRAAGVYYYRVRALVGQLSSAWSEWAVVRVEAAVQHRVESSELYDASGLLSVHRALLRLCAARGDLFAALSLPRHYREEDAVAHATLLRSPLLREVSAVPPLGVAEAGALSFGALYHSWLIGREEHEPDELRTTPPDGVALGIMARRTLARGAWVAPANEPAAGVVALARRVEGAPVSRLYDAQVNVFRQLPRGMMALAADTLSLDPELSAINVRRLLSLVRRAALRLGQEHVFEPNDATFRRMIERAFESLLGQMFERGAFAGKSASSAFQVVAGPELNSPASRDLGRFFVELRVAPSRPLTFITVRLVQSGDRSQFSMEAR